MDTNDALKLDKHIRALQVIIPIESNKDRKIHQAVLIKLLEKKASVNG